MDWWRIIGFSFTAILTVWGIPSMLEDAAVWMGWFDGWQWHNFVMVFGGLAGCFYFSSPLWMPLFSGKSQQEAVSRRLHKPRRSMAEVLKNYWQRVPADLRRELVGGLIFSSLLIAVVMLTVLVIMFAQRFKDLIEAVLS